ncbi:type II secretion system F family protein [Streptomyces chattanoogensis]|uniref:type II secretion system F family protein n=1 Tax=Streptomyces chattanoogensis TaxID=66876 RepID=UPI0036C09A98
MSMVPVVVAGVAVGCGLGLLVRELARPQPSLAAALRRTAAGTSADEARGAAGRDEAVGRWLLERIAHLPGVTVPAKDLALLAQTPERFVLLKAALAVAGLLLPSVALLPWQLAGSGVPLPVPAVLGIVAAAALWFVPDLSVRDQARRAREEFAHAVAAFLDLVALKRAGDAGPTEALEQAASVGDGWAFQRLQQALVRARDDKTSPWQALSELAEDLDLPVLDDVADIMRQSSDDGAAVYATLRGRARSLRAELLEKQAAEANANSEKMTAPGALLAVLVMLLIAFPAVIRIITT